MNWQKSTLRTHWTWRLYCFVTTVILRKRLKFNIYAMPQRDVITLGFVNEQFKIISCAGLTETELENVIVMCQRVP
jgi:hypothetical protein